MIAYHQVPKSAHYESGALGSDALSIFIKWFTTSGLFLHHGAEYVLLCEELNFCREQISNITAPFHYTAFDLNPSIGRPSPLGKINYWYATLGKYHARLSTFSLRFSVAAWSLRQLCYSQLSEVEHRLDDEFCDNQEIIVYAEFYGVI